MFLPEVAPFSLGPQEKAAFLLREMNALLDHHRTACVPYGRVVAEWTARRPGPVASLEEYPYLPVTVFKEHVLKSTTDEVMAVRSSSTTGTAASQVFVDKETRRRQSLSANKILSDFVGRERRPYIVFDVEASVRGVASMSARGAAILSLSHLSNGIHFVMRQAGDSLELDRDALERVLDTIGDAPFIAYGFTYLLYQAHKALAEAGFSRRVHPASTLLHSGGWKKLTAIAVDKRTFNDAVSGIWELPPERVIDFYGAVEQVGIAYPDCAAGAKHVPYWGDVFVRRQDTLAPAGIGETGLLQLMNCLPLAAPNHSILTEDLAELVTLDGCPCGRRGKAFLFRGRAPRAELRGCSDVGR